MAKTKNKKAKKVSSDVLSTKKAVKETKINPFEVQVSREKFPIFGRKSKNDTGLPGVARNKAFQKRKETLAPEYMNKNKTNKFKDKRMGGSNGNQDEMANARYTAEVMNQFNSRKQSLFNLNDDEVLTHKGQTLEEIEKFDDVGASDDDSDEERLNAEFTETAHFGGGDNEDGRKTAIDDMIVESKRKKAERAKDKDELENMTAKLDAKWKSLLPAMSKFTKDDDDEVKPKPDDYDRALREMVFEPRGEVTDRLQTVEDIAKKEKERLEKLERERLERMRDGTDDEKPKHRSADDLDDGYFLQSAPVKKKEVVAYEIQENVEEAKEVESDDDDDDEVADESDDEESDESEDNLSDLKDDSEEEEEIVVKKPVKKPKKQLQKVELPYTYELPDKYEELEELLTNQSPDNQALIVERIFRSNDPNVPIENRKKMISLLAYLLQFIDDQFSSADERTIGDSFKFLDKITPFLFDLSHLNPEKATLCFREIIQEKQNDFRQNNKTYPGLETLVFLKLISTLFPTSDFQHQVATPSLVFIGQLLSRCFVKTRKDVAFGLFLTNLVLEFTQLSKRFLPASFNFLLGVIFLSIKKKPIEILKIIPPFKSTGPTNSILVTSSKMKIKESIKLTMKGTDLVTDEIDDEFKVRALNTALKLSHELFNQSNLNQGMSYLADSFINLLERLELEKYSSEVNENYNKLVKLLSDVLKQPKRYIVEKEKRPKILRMMEPKIETIYDGRKRFQNMSQDKVDREVMRHKIKRETKGAIREIRRDNSFISKMLLKKQIQGYVFFFCIFLFVQLSFWSF